MFLSGGGQKFIGKRLRARYGLSILEEQRKRIRTTSRPGRGLLLNAFKCFFDLFGDSKSFLGWADLLYLRLSGWKCENKASMK